MTEVCILSKEARVEIKIESGDDWLEVFRKIHDEFGCVENFEEYHWTFDRSESLDSGALIIYLDGEDN